MLTCAAVIINTPSTHTLCHYWYKLLSLIQFFPPTCCFDSGLVTQLSQDEATTFYDELNHHIFELVSSSDVNEKKGGILAIGKHIEVLLILDLLKIS